MIKDIISFVVAVGFVAVAILISAEIGYEVRNSACHGCEARV
jgi:hypothetical protein